MSSLPANTKRIVSKTTEKRWRHRFPHYKPLGAFCCYGNQSFDPICPKTLCSLSPTPVMLHIIFDQDWPNGLRDIQVWKCGRRRTDDAPLVYYKLTLWAFGSGELNCCLWIWGDSFIRFKFDCKWKQIGPLNDSQTRFSQPLKVLTISWLRIETLGIQKRPWL